jgi:hypothetical protein
MLSSCLYLHGESVDSWLSLSSHLKENICVALKYMKESLNRYLAILTLFF